MTSVALILSLALAALGVVGMISPEQLIALVRRFQSTRGIVIAGVIRVVLGVSLFLAAPESRAPEILRPLGLLVVLIGFFTPLFGPERFAKMLDWWVGLGNGIIRAWAAVVVASGLALAYAVMP